MWFFSHVSAHGGRCFIVSSEGLCRVWTQFDFGKISGQVQCLVCDSHPCLWRTHSVMLNLAFESRGLGSAFTQSLGKEQVRVFCFSLINPTVWPVNNLVWQNGLQLSTRWKFRCPTIASTAGLSRRLLPCQQGLGFKIPAPVGLTRRKPRLNEISEETCSPHKYSPIKSPQKRALSFSLGVSIAVTDVLV